MNVAQFDEARVEALARRVVDATLAGKGVGEATGALDAERAAAVYTQACALHSQGDYEGAEAAFGWLALRATPDARLFMALGAVRQARERWDSAVEAYSLAALMDVENPAPSYHAAQCLLRAGDGARALKALEAAREQIACAPEAHKDMASRVAALEAFARAARVARAGDDPQTEQKR